MSARGEYKNLTLHEKMEILNKYYVFGHYPSSCFYLKRCPFYFPKHSDSETGFCLRLPVRPTEFGPIDRASLYLRTEIDGDRIQSAKRVLENKQDSVLNKDKTMDNVQKPLDPNLIVMLPFGVK
jgi:hypothetical protein